MMMVMIMVITMMMMMMMMIVRSRIALGLLQSKSVGRSGSWLRTGLTGQRDCDDDGDDGDDDDKCDMGNQYNDGRDKVWSWLGRTLVGQRNATQELGDRVR